jgi:hypothetical protein
LEEGFQGGRKLAACSGGNQRRRHARKRAISFPQSRGEKSWGVVGFLRDQFVKPEGA